MGEISENSSKRSFHLKNHLTPEEVEAAKIISRVHGQSIQDLLNPDFRLFLAENILRYIPVTFSLTESRPEIEKVFLSRMLSQGGLSFDELYGFDSEIYYLKKAFSRIEFERLNQFLESESYKKIIKRYITNRF